MTFLNYLVPALAIVNGALAQCSGSMTITSAAQASSLASCTTYKGSITIAPAASGDITISGVRMITGSLIANGASNMTSLSADSLETIGQDFTLQRLTTLSSLSFPYLTSTNTLTWKFLPGLQGTTFSTGLTQISTLDIEATGLQNLDGFNLTKADSVTIANNQYLQQISFAFTQVTDDLNLNSNGVGQLTASFPMLISAGTINIRNCSSLDISSLKNTTSGAFFQGNQFTSLAAPNLTSTGGLAIENNNNLANISFPKYQMTSQDLSVQNNTDLTGALTFPALTTVRGAVVFRGYFSSLTMSKLNSVRGTMTVLSTKDLSTTCSTFSNEQGNGKTIQGKLDCAPVGHSVSNPGAATLTGSGSMPTKTNAAVRMGSSVPVIGVSGALAAVLGWML